MILLFQQGNSSGSSPFLSMTIQDQIDIIKFKLDEAETLYQHAMARGDWEACTDYKGQVAKYRNQVGKLIRQKLKIA